jgi:hypothetical protein
MIVRLPPLIAAALLACAVVASAAQPTPKPQPLTEAQVRQTLERLVIPKLDFRDASFRDAIDFLSQEAKRLDPKKRGIPFHIRIAPPPSAPAPEPPFDPEQKNITVSLINIPLIEALRYVTGLANLKFRILPDGVHIVSLADPDPMITRDLRVPAASATINPEYLAPLRKNPREWLIANGVAFSEAAAAILDDRGTRLTIHNTKEQIELIEAILHPKPPTPAKPSDWEIENRKRQAEEQASKATIRRKLETIVLPEINLVDVSLKSAVETLKQLSQKHDRRSSAKERGVNLLLRSPEDEAPETGTPVPGIPGLDAPPKIPEPSPATPEPRVTYAAKKVTLKEAINAIVGLAAYHVDIQPYAVCIQKDAPPEELFTREWKIPPELIPRTPTGPRSEEEMRTGIAHREHAKDWLVSGGVTFNGAASSIYIVRSSRLIVRDTEENLRKLDEQIEAARRAHAAAEKAAPKPKKR